MTRNLLTFNVMAANHKRRITIELNIYIHTQEIKGFLRRSVKMINKNKDTYKHTYIHAYILKHCYSREVKIHCIFTYLVIVTLLYNQGGENTTGTTLCYSNNLHHGPFPNSNPGNNTTNNVDL